MLANKCWLHYDFTNCEISRNCDTFASYLENVKCLLHFTVDPGSVLSSLLSHFKISSWWSSWDSLCLFLLYDLKALGCLPYTNGKYYIVDLFQQNLGGLGTFLANVQVPSKM